MENFTEVELIESEELMASVENLEAVSEELWEDEWMETQSEDHPIY